MNETSLIKDIGRSYIISSFIPAALFIALGIILFHDFTPSLLTTFENPDNLHIGEWGFFVILVSWVGFGLYSGWHATVKLFEGYYFGPYLSTILKNRLENEFRKKTININRVKSLQQKKDLTDDERSILKNNDQKALMEYSIVSMDFPMNAELLPTRLGNILRASECYSYERYKLEAIISWPRLIHLFPKEYTNQLEEENNKFIFLLNSSFLSIILGLFAWLMVFFRLPCYFLNPNLSNYSISGGYWHFACTLNNTPINFFQKGFTRINETKYLFLGLFLVGMGYVIYRIAAVTAKTFANLIRSGYDLYRFELIKAYHIPLPSTLEDEKLLWEKISRFIISDDDLSNPDNGTAITYDHGLNCIEQDSTHTPLPPDVNGNPDPPKTVHKNCVMVEES